QPCGLRHRHPVLLPVAVIRALVRSVYAIGHFSQPRLFPARAWHTRPHTFPLRPGFGDLSCPERRYRRLTPATPGRSRDTRSHPASRGRPETAICPRCLIFRSLAQKWRKTTTLPDHSRHEYGTCQGSFVAIPDIVILRPHAVMHGALEVLHTRPQGRIGRGK